MKSMNTYLIFEGNCRQAMEFYKECLGGVLYMMPYGEAPGCEGMPAKTKNWIIHARLTIKTNALMASDTRPDLPVKHGNNFFVNLNCETIEEAEKYFKALAEGGKIDMSLQESFFAVRFGMLTDKFGIKWMFNLEKPKE